MQPSARRMTSPPFSLRSSIAAPDWAPLLPQGVTTADVVEAAVERWKADAPVPALVSGQHLWLAALSGNGALIEGEAASEDRQTAASLALLGCDADGSGILLNPTPSEQRGNPYWVMRVMQAV